jgi:acetyltransferase-like isoleucine patch superfamily enzyme
MAAESIVIGDACMIAHGVYISDADWHGIYEYGSNFKFFTY